MWGGRQCSFSFRPGPPTFCLVLPDLHQLTFRLARTTPALHTRAPVVLKSSGNITVPRARGAGRKPRSWYVL
eukprot:2584125-Pyramimonas_sp.AAC.2